MGTLWRRGRVRERGRGWATGVVELPLRAGSVKKLAGRMWNISVEEPQWS